MTELESALQPVVFTLPVPDEKAPWLLFLSITGCTAGEVLPMPEVKGMAVVKISETGW